MVSIIPIADTSTHYRCDAIRLAQVVKPLQAVLTGGRRSRTGEPKFISACTLPLTGRNVVDMLITELCVFQRPDHQSSFRMVEMAPGVSLEEIAAKTTARYVL